MKYKINKVETHSEAYYEVLCKKSWWAPWSKVKAFYKSPFEEMPGWWSECFPTELDAVRAMEQHRIDKKVTSTTIYSE